MKTIESWGTYPPHDPDNITWWDTEEIAEQASKELHHSRITRTKIIHGKETQRHDKHGRSRAMPELSNADKARELLANLRSYRAEAEADTARAQVYALLAIADALTTKDNR